MAIEIVDFPIKRWWLSIAMLNYQRVGTNKQNGTLNKQNMGAENTMLGLQQQRNMGIEAIEIGT